MSRLPYNAGMGRTLNRSRTTGGGSSKSKSKSEMQRARGAGHEGAFSWTANTTPPRTLTGELANQTSGDGTSSPTPSPPHTLPCPPSFGRRRRPRPSARRRSQSRAQGCTPAGYVWSSPEYRGPKLTLRTAVGGENNPKIMNIQALCAAPPEAFAHSPSQMPLSCPVAPPSQRELHKDRAAAVVAWRGGRAPPGPRSPGPAPRPVARPPKRPAPRRSRARPSCVT